MNARSGARDEASVIMPAADHPRFDRFDGDPVTVARRLLGQRLVRLDDDGTRVGGRIVETEAYLGAVDRASHTWRGRHTPRNASMWLEGGHAYVYFTYGMHWCFNVVTGRAGAGTAVLIRAIEPEEGLERMRHRRGVDRLTLLCSGPARLTQALAIDRSLDGDDLRRSPRVLIERLRRRTLRRDRIAVTPRIGVDSAGEWASRPLRFCVAGSSSLSRPAPAPVHGPAAPTPIH